MHTDQQNIDKHPVAKQDSIIGQVPIIDIGDLVSDSSSLAAKESIEQIAAACRDWGFFQVINHSTPPELIETVLQQTHRMFALPLKEKLSVVRTKDNPWGFYNNELTKNQRDKKEVFDFTHEGIDPIYGKSNRWLVDQIKFKATMLEYFDACTVLSLTLLEAFCIGLDLPAKYMHDDFASNHTGFMRLNYYPVKDPLTDSSTDHQPVADLGIHHHTDAGALTVLLQDEVSGLQVYRDGYWHDIPPVPGAMVINIGDMMQVWSNDTYQAAIHRVLAMDSIARYSLPFFFNPSASSRVSPLPTVINEQQPSHYNTIEWSSYRGLRTDGDFANYGTEVQISQFRK
ncbi:MAG: isopenicillin N synthase family dioxygenase [Gammaproteobacteria bacterium]